jgi:hypothetical protein
MTRHLAAAAALLMLTSSIVCACPEPVEGACPELVEEAQPMALRFGRVWDGTRVIPDAVVIIDGGRIVSVGPAGKDLPVGADDRSQPLLHRREG